MVETRQVLGGLVGAAVLIGLVGSLVYALVVWTDAITNGLVHSHWGQRALGNWRDVGDAYGETTAAGHSASSLLSSADPAAPANGTPLDDGSGAPWILRLLITVLTVFFGVLVWVELQIREGALLLVVVFSGLAFASFAWPRHRGLAHSFAMLIAGVVVAKLVIVTTLLVGGSLTQTAAAGGSGAGTVKGMLTGVGLMGLAAFAGWWTVSWFGLHGAGAVGQAGGTIRAVGLGTFPGGGRADIGGTDDGADVGPPRPPAGGEGPARELAMDAATRLPDAHAAPRELIAGLAAAERVHRPASASSATRPATRRPTPRPPCQAPPRHRRLRRARRPLPTTGTAAPKPIAQRLAPTGIPRRTLPRTQGAPKQAARNNTGTASTALPRRATPAVPVRRPGHPRRRGRPVSHPRRRGGRTLAPSRGRPCSRPTRARGKGPRRRCSRPRPAGRFRRWPGQSGCRPTSPRTHSQMSTAPSTWRARNARSASTPPRPTTTCAGAVVSGERPATAARAGELPLRSAPWRGRAAGPGRDAIGDPGCGAGDRGAMPV